MNCFNCGAPVKEEHNTCPYCGKSLQIVPDYNVFDDDDISILMEAGTQTSNTSKAVQQKKPSPSKRPMDREAAERIRARKEKERQRKLERKKKIQLVIILIAVIAICALLFVAFFVVSDMIEEKNANSFDYQVKQAEAALDSGDFETAEAYYMRALELDKDDIEVRFTLADMYKTNNMPEKMIAMYKEIIKLDKVNYTAYKALFQYYSSINDVAAILELRSGVTNNRILALFENYEVDVPTISKKGGTYSNSIEVMISSKLENEIYYTIDGSDPTANGILYNGKITLDQTGMVTLKVVAKNEIGVFSSMVQETYYLEYEAPDAPVVTPDGGAFDKITYITIVVPSGCTAYYSWDGIDPTMDSLTKLEYTEPIIVPSGKNVLRVMIYDNKTGFSSTIYRKVFECSVEGIEVPIIIIPEDTETESGTKAGQ